METIKQQIVNMLLSKGAPIFLQELIDEIPNAQGDHDLFMRVKKNQNVMVAFNCSNEFYTAYIDLKNEGIINWDPVTDGVGLISAMASGVIPQFIHIVYKSTDPILDTKRECFMIIKISIKIAPKHETLKV